jgi:hypothetical protein
MTHSFHNRGCGCDPSTLEGAQLDTLYPYIQLQQCATFNTTQTNAVTNIIRPYELRNETDKYIESFEDDDEDEAPELAIFITFSSTVNLRSFTLKSRGAESDDAPVEARLFINRDDLDLGSVRDMTPAQVVTLAPDVDGSIDQPVKQSKFQNVTSLFMHIKGTPEQTKLHIDWLHLKGVNTGARRAAVNVSYEVVPNLSDHSLKHLQTNNASIG